MPDISTTNGVSGTGGPGPRAPGRRGGAMGELTRFPGRCPPRAGLPTLEQQRLLQWACLFQGSEPEAAAAFRLMADGHWRQAARAWRRVRQSGSSLHRVARDMIPYCRRNGRPAQKASLVLPFACPLDRPPRA